MAVQVSNAHSTSASPLFLREAEIRRGVELLYFGYSHLTQAADVLLEAKGLGRAHHRALYFVARQPDLTVSDLLALLAITKQSLGRVLIDLGMRNLIESRAGKVDRRQKLLRLTDSGAALELALFEALRSKLAIAYGDAGQAAVSGFWQVLEGLIPPTELARVIALQAHD